MTLEELRLRAIVAFPECRVEMSPDWEGFVSIKAGGTSFLLRWQDEGLAIYFDGSTAPTDKPFMGRAFFENRILSVSAHEIIAARRRFALEELARLDADLIISEPPADAH